MVPAAAQVKFTTSAQKTNTDGPIVCDRGIFSITHPERSPPVRAFRVKRGSERLNKDGPENNRGFFKSRSVCTLPVNVRNGRVGKKGTSEMKLLGFASASEVVAARTKPPKMPRIDHTLSHILRGISRSRTMEERTEWLRWSKQFEFDVAQHRRIQKAADMPLPGLSTPKRSIKALTKAIRKAREKAGLPYDVKLHGVRHFYATRAVLNRVDIATLAEWLGHEQIATTMR